MGPGAPAAPAAGMTAVEWSELLPSHVRLTALAVSIPTNVRASPVPDRRPSASSGMTAGEVATPSRLVPSCAPPSPRVVSPHAPLARSDFAVQYMQGRWERSASAIRLPRLRLISLIYLGEIALLA